MKIKYGRIEAIDNSTDKIWVEFWWSKTKSRNTFTKEVSDDWDMSKVIVTKHHTIKHIQAAAIARVELLETVDELDLKDNSREDD